jgi:hypothetical protein
MISFATFNQIISHRLLFIDASALLYRLLFIDNSALLYRLLFIDKNRRIILSSPCTLQTESSLFQGDYLFLLVPRFFIKYSCLPPLFPKKDFRSDSIFFRDTNVSPCSRYPGSLFLHTSPRAQRVSSAAWWICFKISVYPILSAVAPTKVPTGFGGTVFGGGG